MLAKDIMTENPVTATELMSVAEALGVSLPPGSLQTMEASLAVLSRENSYEVPEIDVAPSVTTAPMANTTSPQFARSAM